MNVVPIRSNIGASDTSNTNFVGLDAIRAFAALGVVALHACVPYLRNPMPGLAWPVDDTDSRIVDGLFWSIEVFIMPVFLVLAGFLAWRTLSRRGPKRLVTSRARRLLIPLAFGMICVLPVDLYVWVLGWVGEGLVEPVKLKSLKIDGELGDNMWGLSHLWFLLYLFLYVAATAAIHRLVSNTQSTRLAKLAKSLTRPKTAICLLGIAGVATLVVSPEVVWGFQHAFAPVPGKWIYSATFFAGGILLAANDGRLRWLTEHAHRIAVPAWCLLAATVTLGQWQLGQSQLAETENAASNVLLAILTVASAWLVTLCLIGLATKHVRRVSTSVQYLAAASFWIYLVHHPLLGLVHTDLKVLLPETAPLLKTLIAFSISTLVSLLMYESMIRKTWLGNKLGFAWQFPQATAEGTAPELKQYKQKSTEPLRRAA